jgi:thiol:disulfide interchange protein
VPTRRLVVSTYLQYILIAVGVFLLVVFVRQLSGVLLTFLMAAILAYVLNPPMRRLERWRVPRVLAVVGVFVVGEEPPIATQTIPSVAAGLDPSLGGSEEQKPGKGVGT